MSYEDFDSPDSSSSTSYSSLSQEKEFNGTPFSADPITLGTKMFGQLSSWQDVDYFKYSVSGPVVLNAAVDLPTNNSYIDYFAFDIVDSTGNTLSRFTSGQDGTLRAAVSQAGTYYVRVATSGYYHSRDLYGFTLTESSFGGGYETEPNGYNAYGDVLVPGQKMYGQLYAAEDVDFFYVNATTAGALNVSFDAPTSSQYSNYFRVSILDSAFNALSAVDTGVDEQLSAGIDTPGTYWVKVQGSGYYHDDGQYSVTATFGNQAGSVETEGNNTLATADALSVGSKIVGQLSSSSDIDYFKYTTTGAALLSVAIDLPTNSEYLDYFTVDIVDATGNTLSRLTSGKDGTLLAAVSQPGTYYVKVGSAGFYQSQGLYGVTLTEAAFTGGYETEPNGYNAHGDALIDGQKMRGQLFDSSDVDFFYINAGAAGLLSVSFDAPTDSQYIDYFKVSLLDSEFNVLSALSTGADGQVQAGLPAAGVYWVKVQSAGFYHDNGQYGVTATLSTQAGGTETESNNTLATADALTLNTVMVGQLSSASDIDFYKLTVSSSGVGTISFDAPTNSIYSDYFSIKVYDEAGTLLVRKTTGSDIAFQTGLQNQGTYYVAVTAGDWLHHAGQYALTFSATAGAGGYESEPNDEYANFLATGESKRGQLSTSEDIDWFYVELDSGGELSLDVDLPTNSAYTDYFRIWVFDESYNLLASRSTGQDLRFEVNVPEAGTYFVGITSDYFHDAGEYVVKVDALAKSVLRESETNDSMSSADVIPLSETIRGQLSLADDADYFSFVAQSAGQFSIKFDGPTNSSWTNFFQVDLIDSDGNFIVSRDTGADLTIDTPIERAGTYFVRVSGGDFYYDDGEYRLTVTATLEDTIPEGALVGSPLGDRLLGTNANDLIYGLGGNDLIDGGGGQDTVVFRSSSAHLTINSVEGLTAVRGDYGAGEHAYSVTRLWNVERVTTQTGTEVLSAQTVAPILGTAASDVIRGTAQSDLIDGLGGSDFIDGGTGTDVLVLFGSESHFSTLTVAGITQIQAGEKAAEYAGHTIKVVNVESLAFNQNQARPLTTTALNKVFGSSAGESLFGTVGDDVFDGQGGNDTLDGGAGEDTVALFGRVSDFTITYPTINNPLGTVEGNSGTAWAKQKITLKNIEAIAFVDQTVSIVNPPKIVLTPTSLFVEEGGATASLSLALSTAPNAPVSLILTGDSNVQTAPSTLTFTSNNWSVPQTVTVSAIDDTLYEGQHKGSVSVAIQTTDSLYAALSESTLTYTVSDNDSQTRGTVRGRLWNDFDKDGVMDAAESGLSGWTVFSDGNGNGKRDSNEVWALTGLNGSYALEDLAPGTHTIVAEVAKGWLPTYPNSLSQSATVIRNTASGRELSIETPLSIEISASDAEAIYTNLGLATNIAGFHADPRFEGIDGQGYTVVVIDTGIDLDHPYFGPDLNRDGVSDRIVYHYDFVGKNDADASDGNGHGTHVSGIVGSSNSSFPGVAPSANIIALKVLSDSGSGSAYDIQEALNWTVQNVEKYNIVAVNLSLGSGEFHTSPFSGYLSTQFKSLASSGVVVVSASGNDYDDNPVQGVSYPSSDPFSLSVGAVWSSPGSVPGWQSGVTDAIAYFSQRDDTLSDIFAPGVFIDSAWLNGAHKAISGTSMATPEIAGMVTLGQQLAEQELGRRLTFSEIRELLYDTGALIVDGDDENDTVPNTGLSFKRVDMLAFAEGILALKPPVSHTVTVVAGAVTTSVDFGFASASAVQGLSSDDLVIGTSLGEALWGGSGADRISGGDGDDDLYGEEGDDLLRGEGGDDFLEGGPGNDTIEGGEGWDIVFFSREKSAYEISLTVDGAVVSDQRSGGVNDGTDVVRSAEVLRFTDQDFTVGAQLLDQTAPAIVAMLPGEGAYNVGPSSNIVLTFDEPVQRGAGSIQITRSDGSIFESFDASQSPRLAISGSTLTIDPTSLLSFDTQYIVTIGAGAVRDSSGNQFLAQEGLSFSTINDFLSWIPPDIASLLELTAYTEVITGADQPEALTGTQQSEILQGAGGADTIFGGEGNDFLFGFENYEDDDATPGSVLRGRIDAQGGLVDHLYGGPGNDLYILDRWLNATPQVVEEAGEGLDLIFGGAQAYQLPTHVEFYVNDSSISDGAGKFTEIVITGNDSNNLIRSYGYEDDWQSWERFLGLSGDDTLHGFGGNDHLDGGQGNDLAIYSGLRSDYVLTKTDAGVLIEDTRRGQENDGIDTLIGIEVLRFSDGDQTLSSLLPNSDVSGHVYHWKSRALLAGVEVGENRAVTTTDGVFSLQGLPPGGQSLSIDLAITSLEMGNVISSADALAALKIAVGRNPNSDGTPVSPYQFISADVNEDGKVSSADALAILKMAVKRLDAPAREWIFVDEMKDFWNEGSGGVSATFSTTRSAVPKPEDLAIVVDPALRSEVNLVAMLKGDVNGSWVRTTAGESLPLSYFQSLAAENPSLLNLAQFG